MKHLYLIGGTMGVGKSTVCQIMKRRLPNAVFLDGDWCWDMDPFHVTEETKAMVLTNICFLLNNALQCSAFENIIFCWVMHEQPILDTLYTQLDTSNCRIHSISLICDPKALEKRLQHDIERGLRTFDIIQRSLDRLPLYEKLKTQKVNVTQLTPQQSANLIIKTTQQ